MTVLVCAAHADDEVIGLGGTIAKLAKEEDVIVLIFSYGADFAGRLLSWPPTLSEEKLTKKRIYESRKAGDVLGVKETIFLGLRGGEDLADIAGSHKQLIQNIISKYNPNKFFFHSIKDSHPDHRLVNKVMTGLISKMEPKPEVYTYQVNLIDLSHRQPKIIFDVTNEFMQKLKALDVFKTQVISIALLKPLILLKAMTIGKRHNIRFAEYFFAE
jgi:LmbE family N-acetylglucosaminyl deacetylase